MTELSAIGVFVLAAACIGIASCAPGSDGIPFGGRQPPPAMREAIQSALAERAKLKAFDANADTDITVKELESGLERSFAEHDLNKDGKLRANEITRANERLSAEDATMPPLRDWNQSGAVEFDEFAAWNRGRFRRADSDQDGTITQAELIAPPKMPNRPPSGMPPGGKPPGGMPPGGKPPGGGMSGGRLSQSVATTAGGDI